MTMRLDIVTNDAGELVRREHARDLGAQAVIAIYRLAKLAQMHDLQNQAFTRQLEQTHQQIVEYGLRAGMHVNILFAQRAVFVAGQLLKGSRSTYEMASELGDILEWCGGQELTIQRDVTEQEIYAFAEAVSVAMRLEKGKGFRSPTSKIRLRPVTDAARLRGLEIESLSQEQRIVRNYASAVVIMRRFFEDLENSRYILPRRIKRVAQNLVDLSEGSTPAFLGVTEVRNQNHDDAGRAVNTAILAVTIARELTSDRVALAQIAMAAMMHDVGRPRAAALAGGGGPRMTGVVAKLSEEAEDKLATGTAAVLTALGRLNEPTITRTVVAFEALWMRRQKWIGAVYRGVRPPTLQSRILAVARRYNDLLTPEPGLPPPLPDFAVATLAEELKDPADRAVLRMLVAALGLFPIGTVVQLTTGEVGEVIPRADRRASDRPHLRLVMDAHGAVYEQNIELDLAADSDRRIIKVINVDGWSKGLAALADSDGRLRAASSPPEAARRESPSASVPSIASITSISHAAREPPNESLGSGVVETRRGSAPPTEGTSPSMVGGAIGVRPSVREAPAIGEPRTVTATSPLEESERARAELKKRRTTTSPPVAEPLHVPKDLMPTARGTLASTPVVHTLVYMFDHGLSGTVLLREADGAQHAVFFHEGAPAKARTSRAIALLGDVLVAAHAVQAEKIPPAIDASRRLGTLLGEYLVGETMLSRETLSQALSSQVAHKIAGLVNLPPETDYAFYQDHDLLETWAGGERTPCHPLNAILGTVRAWHDRARMRATLGRIAKQPLSFHVQADLSPVNLTAEESLVVDAIRDSRSTITALYQQQVVDEESVSSIVYALAVTRCFAFTSAKGPPMGLRPASGAFSAAFPMALTPSEGSHRVVPAVALPPVSLPAPSLSAPPPTSSVPPSPQSKPVPRIAPVATWRPSPKSNPPSTPSPEVADTPIDGVHAEAKPSLRDKEGDEAERALQAMTDFRLAETALQRNDLKAAERYAIQAVEGEPTNGEYIALLAWLSALSGKNDAVNEAIAKLSDVLRDDALCERALLYRGKLLKRMNRHSEALRDFQLVLDVSPKSSEAASEARLLRMQKKKR